MRAKEFTFEAKIGTEPKRPARPGSRPERGHEPQKRYVTDRKTGKQYDPEEEFDKLKNSDDFIAQMKRMSTKEDSGISKDKETKFHAKLDKLVHNTFGKRDDEMEEQFCEECGGSLAEAGKASRELCKSSKPDADLGASNLASCKSQGLRARDGEKSHKLGKGPKSRVTVGGHRIKGRKYGGPLPDWS